MLVSERVKTTMHTALLHRCRSLERQLPLATSMHLSTLDSLQFSALPTEPRTGLYAYMSANNFGVEVVLSSVHGCTSLMDPLAILRLDTAKFGTQNQSDSNQPWIELKSKQL